MSLPILQEQRGALGGLVQGLGLGLQQAMPSISEMILSKQKQKQNLDLLRNIKEGNRGGAPDLGISSMSESDKEELFRNLALAQEQESGKDLSPQDLNDLWGAINQETPPPQQGRFSPEEEEILALEAMKDNPDFASRLTDIEKMNRKERLEERKFEAAERKEVAPYVKSIVSGYDAAQVSKANLDRMGKLEKDGQLIGPWGVILSRKLGIPISVLGNPGSEEYEKLISQRALNVAQAYGFGRILQTEFENFLRSIPSLMNSPEGRTRIRESLRYFDDLAIKRYEIYKDIKKKNRGKTPIDIQEKVSERMEPEYEKAREKLVGPSVVPSKSLDEIFGD